MAAGIVVGAVAVEVVPSAKGFSKKLADQIMPNAASVGQRLGKQIGDNLNKEVVKATRNGVIKGAQGLKITAPTVGSADTKDAEKDLGKFAQAYQKRVNALSKAIPRVKIDADSSEADRKVAALKAEIEALKGIDITVDGNVAEAEAKLSAVEAMATRLATGDYNVTIRTNAAAVLAEIEALKKQLREGLDLDVGTDKAEREIGAFARAFKARIAEMSRSVPDIDVGVNTSGADFELAVLKGIIKEIGDIDINVDANIGLAKAKLDQVEIIAKRLDGENVTLDVKANLAKVLAELALVKVALGATEDESNKAGKSLAGLGRGGGGLSGLIGNLGGMTAQAALANGSILLLGSALFALAPLAAPIATTLVGGIIAIGTAAVFAVGGLGVLVIALSSVISGLQKYIQSRQQSAQLAAQELSQTTSLANARDSVTTATRNLARAQTNATKSVRQANQSLRNAETSLSDAQRSQKRAQVDLTQARKDATRQIQELNLEVTRGMLDQRQATLDLQDARTALANAQNDPTATEEDRQRALLAYQQQEQSLKEIQQKNKENAQDKAKADKSGVDGTDTVVNALEQLRSANEQVVQSQQSVVDAAQAAADAQISAADSVRDAQQSLIQSQRALQVALAQPAPGTDWTQGLTKQEQDFIKYLYATFVPAYKRVKAIVEAPIFSGLKVLFADLTGSQTKIEGVFTSLAGAVGDFFGKLGKFTQGEHFQAFLDYLSKNAGPILGALGDAFIGISDAFVQILVAFGPSSDKIISALAGMIVGFANFFADFAKSDKFKQFIDYMDKNGPVIVGLFGALIVGFGKLFVALAPLGAAVAVAVGAFADLISSLPPSVILAIGAALLIVVGVLLGFAESALVIPVAVAAIVLLIGWLYKLGAIQAVIKALKPVFSDVINFCIGLFHSFMDNTVTLRQMFKDVFDLIVVVLKIFYYGVFKPIFFLLVALLKYVVWPVIKALYYGVIKPVFTLIMVLLDVLYIAFRIAFEIVKLLIMEVGDVFYSLYKDYIKPAWEKGIKPVLSFIAPYFKKYVVDVLRDNISALGKLWDNLVKLIGTPIYAIAQYVLNDGLLYAVNKVFHTFDHSWKDAKIDTAKLKQYSFFSEGGVLPGYAPRRDSVPAMLSPGEGVLVPEAVRAIGPAQILDWNAKAMAGQRIQHFATGGIVADIVSFEKNADIPFKVSSGLREGDSGYHGKGEAVDTTSSTAHMVGLAKWLYQRAGYLLELIHSAGNGGQGFFVKDGKQVPRSFYASEIAAHYNHVHTAMNEAGLTKARAAGYSVTNTGTGENDTAGTSLTDVVSGLAGTISGGVAKGIQTLKSKAGSALESPFVNEVLSLPGITVKKALAYAKDHLAAFVGKTIGAVKNSVVSAYDYITGQDEENAKSKTKGYHASKGTAQAYAKNSLPLFGWDAGQWSSLNPLWQGESSWRWNATGDSTSLGRAYGIPQSLPATKMATIGSDWHDNAFTQIGWGLKYIKDRYGSPADAFAFWEAQSPHYYDQGGYLPPGISVVRNDTGKPEPVLTDGQWQTMLEARQSAASGAMEIGVRVHDGAVPGLVSAHVDKAFGVLADANIYGGI